MADQNEAFSTGGVVGPDGNLVVPIDESQWYATPFATRTLNSNEAPCEELLALVCLGAILLALLACAGCSASECQGAALGALFTCAQQAVNC